MLDNYDSFVFNLVQYLGELGAEPIVHRNDTLTVDEALALEPDGVLVSPGPGRPEDAGIICDAVAAFAERHAGARGVPRRRAFTEGGLTREEFDTFPPTVRTLRQFIAACHDLDGQIRELMLPNPNLPGAFASGSRRQVTLERR